MRLERSTQGVAFPFAAAQTRLGADQFAAKQDEVGIGLVHGGGGGDPIRRGDGGKG
jgi:hypothetical protein